MGNEPLKISHASLVSGETLWEWRRQALAQARQEEIPEVEIDWLLQEVAGLEPLALRLETYRERSHIPLPVSWEQWQALWQRRRRDRLPVQYIAGQTCWRGLSLKVSPSVLIPRPETELIIDLAIALAPPALPPEANHWADLGTGSGAIAIALAAAFPDATIHAVDCSPEALAVARDNAQRLGCGDRIQFYLGSWFEPLEHLRGRLAGAIANPPYIPSALIPHLQPEVARHEPHLALDGGEDGLDCIRQLVSDAVAYLTVGGVFLTEMMVDQAPEVLHLLHSQGNYDRIATYPDLAGIDRFAGARLAP